MLNEKRFEERRIYRRFKSSGGMIAVLNPHSCVLGNVIDISKSGVGIHFHHYDENFPAVSMDLYLQDKGFLLKNINVIPVVRKDILVNKGRDCTKEIRCGFRFDFGDSVNRVSDIPEQLPVFNESNRINEIQLSQIEKKDRSSLAKAVARRCIDMAVSFVAIIVFMPLMLFIAFYIKMDSPGPALFRQKRVGKNGRLFTFYKFRTMWADAKERFPELYEYNFDHKEIESLLFKNREDPRVTRAGKKLRKSSLDELPNFINVLKGDMTLVGPRPDIPEMIRYYTQEQMLKLSQKPGVTGFAQINGRGRLNFQETLSEDIEYIKERSIATDLKILFKTVVACFYGKGAF